LYYSVDLCYPGCGNFTHIYTNNEFEDLIKVYAPCTSKKCVVNIIAESDQCSTACTVPFSRWFRSPTHSSSITFEIKSKTPLNEAVVMSNLNSNISNANDDLTDDGSTFRINSNYNIATAKPTLSPSTLKPTGTPKPFAEKPVKRPTAKPTQRKGTAKPVAKPKTGKSGKSSKGAKIATKSSKSNATAHPSKSNKFSQTSTHKKQKMKQKKKLQSDKQQSMAVEFADKHDNIMPNTPNLTKKEKKEALKKAKQSTSSQATTKTTNVFGYPNQLTKKEKKTLLMKEGG
jgi:hypothetical protein